MNIPAPHVHIFQEGEEVWYITGNGHAKIGKVVSDAVCHGSDYALTPPPATPVMFNTWCLSAGQVQIFQHHSDPIPATPIAEIAASPLLCIWLPLLPSHPLVSFPVPLSHFHFHLHTPFTPHLSLCHMFKTPIPLSYHHQPSQPCWTSRFTIALDFHKYLFSLMHRIVSCIVYSRVEGI
jgi:hypothetical protein